MIDDFRELIVALDSYLMMDGRGETPMAERVARLMEAKRKCVEAVNAEPTPAPVPVAERLPEADDCNAEGRCWRGYMPLDGAMGHTPATWRLIKPEERFGPEDAWAPHWALSLPGLKS